MSTDLGSLLSSAQHKQMQAVKEFLHKAHTEPVLLKANLGIPQAEDENGNPRNELS